jgi:hypothetical protein
LIVQEFGWPLLKAIGEVKDSDSMITAIFANDFRKFAAKTKRNVDIWFILVV